MRKKNKHSVEFATHVVDLPVTAPNSSAIYYDDLEGATRFLDQTT